MEHRRPETGTPAAAGPLTGERARAAGTADPGTTDDQHVAGPAPAAPGAQAPETAPPTVPDPIPGRAPGRDTNPGAAPARNANPAAAPVKDAGALKTPSQEANQARTPVNDTNTAKASTRDTDPTGIPVQGTEPKHAAPRKPGTPGTAAGGAPDKLFDPAEAERLRQRWHEVQAAFVDDPGESVRKADALASEAVDALGRALAAQRRSLTEALDGGEQADTERLRLTLRRYRDLLDRIYAA
ncbi:hypothetical protein [Actinomadura sp. WMMA1423]|uniref:hypothetical protein n=1 Tax=Actinomadura sp. WMMA1423 TaxID=2591108 RepID=UPI001146DB21|nr:hypothetical protein [Actinomadura sp. WMMA1423]